MVPLMMIFHNVTIIAATERNPTMIFLELHGCSRIRWPFKWRLLIFDFRLWTVQFNAEGRNLGDLLICGYVRKSAGKNIRANPRAR